MKKVKAAKGKTKRGLLWVEVTKTSVRLHEGSAMPAPIEKGFAYLSFFGGNIHSREEFARWSGVTLPDGDGIYGLALDFHIISRHRKVVEETRVDAYVKKNKWVVVP